MRESGLPRFCGIDRDGTEPGKTGLPGVRRTADRRWAKIQDVRRRIAGLLEAAATAADPE